MLKKICFALFFVLVAVTCRSQCTKGLGTPLINETFGAGTAVNGPPLPAGVTNMMYGVNTCPLDGIYSIINYTSGCFNEWHTLTDHTGDKGGYFMLIDASYQPSDFFVQTVSGLCDGTTFQFSAWIINMFQISGGIDPNVTFTIEKTDGTVLKTYDTGDIDITVPALWKQFAFGFTTPPGVSTVVLRMHNNAPGGQGNDLGIDDITFRPTGPATSIAARGYPGSKAVVLCSDQTTLTSAVESCYVNTAYQWQTSADSTSWADIPGATGATYQVSLSATGTYFYRLTVAESGNIGNPNCRVNSNIYTIDHTVPAINKFSVGICNGNAYPMPSGKKISKAGAYIDTLRSLQGCDSLYTYINLLVKPSASSSLSATICQGETYLGHTQTGIYTDTLQASNGCDSVRKLDLTVNPRAVTDLTIAICRGDNYGGYTKTGIYTDTLKAASGCDSLLVINLTVGPSLSLGPDRSLCPGDSIILNPGVFSTYLWQDGSAAPTYKVTAAGAYHVTVTDDNGCKAADTVLIKQSGCTLSFIPNTFTPNGDGINDTWDIGGLVKIAQSTVFIYDRWGRQVFSSKGYAKPWDGTYNGKKLPFGTYYYLINLNNGTALLSGFVMLMR